ncbi:hypothetical protein [Nibribacter koreensis]|uniref:Uncharacterized protein n=1 Tax=Nibribacter koreensis TaxID=1084519 RepID=A0ABP8FQ80_9BACT
MPVQTKTVKFTAYFYLGSEPTAFSVPIPTGIKVYLKNLTEALRIDQPGPNRLPRRNEDKGKYLRQEAACPKEEMSVHGQASAVFGLFSQKQAKNGGSE